MKIEDWGDFPKEFADRARQVAKKFVRFDTLIAPAVIQVLFWVWAAFAVISGIALIPFAPVSGLGMIVLGPLVARIAAELLLVVFRLLVNLNERLEPPAEERLEEPEADEPSSPKADAEGSEPDAQPPGDEDTGPLTPPPGPLPPVPVS